MAAPSVWMVASEAAPLVRTGGLGEVLHALPLALARQGLAVRRVLPGYRCIDRSTFERVHATIHVPLGDGSVEVSFLTRHESSGVQTTLVHCPALYDRDEVYGPPGSAYADNARRFALFSRAVCELVGLQDRPPEVLHGHDWQAGPALLFAKQSYVWHPAPKTVFTVHNLGYSGRFAAEQARELALGAQGLARVLHPEGIEFHGDVSFLKAGLVYADRITTVSPTYAREILEPEQGFGLDGLLRARADVLEGILNGLDYEVWNPETDPWVAENYGCETLSEKSASAVALRRRLGLEAGGQRPILGVVSRLDHQKGIDVFVEAAPALLAAGVDLVVLGAGDPELAVSLERLVAAHPGRVGLWLGFDEALSHLLVAGSDLLGLPSRYEPCGLAQLQALRYGTVPVVRRTGGLADTVLDVRADPQHGTGFVFDVLTAEVLVETVRAAIALRAESPDRWHALQLRGMAADFSWDASARRYAALYQELLSP